MMNEFMTQIKSNSELHTLFDSIQKDVSTTTSDTALMDLS